MVGIYMGKYSKLRMYLGDQNETRIQLTFSEIGEILGFPLPPAARNHPAWWTNDENRTHAMDGWLAQGWKAKVNFELQQVSFLNTGNTVSTKDKMGDIRTSATINASDFENKVRTVMSDFYSKELVTGQFPGFSKSFYMISDENEIVGDIKYFTMTNEGSLPPAEFSVIAEHVWLLEKTTALHKFLVFGNERRVPEEWLKIYGNLVHDVDFFFYNYEDDRLEKFVLK
ncbi:hypothetical protein J7W08_06065 [Methanococcoides orientis]|uniref:DUF7662 domain-containing protein n=1 Tax=Methanococcoides orientis TaxID=2822137 RepID=UPI001E65B65B|nr:hypothetical protein [Methanococcoides orientis]UGV39708.1 hypothetical protein J7W08_06065 [Methanococcoides orientis]